MSLLDRFKRKKAGSNWDSNWDNAYTANPQFYEHSEIEGQVLGAFALTETVDTILPQTPRYLVEDVLVDKWELVLVSISNESLTDTLDYHEAIKELEPYIVEQRGDFLLVRGLNADEMARIIQNLKS